MGIGSSQAHSKKELPNKSLINWYDNEGNIKRNQLTQVAICFSYIGTEFHGLSFNRNNHTVSRTLQDAMARLGIVPPDKTRTNLFWVEASRTDTGVHAAAQVITMRIAVPKGYKAADMTEMLNEYLGEDSPIHVWSIIAPGMPFEAQKMATSRRYYYMLPIAVLSQQTPEHIEFLNKEICSRFVGKHCFANYTKKTDKKMTFKTITEFSAGDIFVVDGQKFVLYKICGTSFMLNQIRKMMGTVIAASHNLITAKEIDDTLNENSVWLLPRLIGAGLFLDEVQYEGSKIVKEFPRETAPAGKDVHFSRVRGEIEMWKKKSLFPHIASIAKKGDFNKWVKECLMPYPPARAEENNI